MRQTIRDVSRPPSQGKILSHAEIAALYPGAKISRPSLKVVKPSQFVPRGTFNPAMRLAGMAPPPAKIVPKSCPAPKFEPSAPRIDNYGRPVNRFGK